MTASTARCTAVGLALLLVTALVVPVAAAAKKAAGAKQGTLAIHFENVELPVFIKFISKVTGKNFVFSEKVAGTVTVVSPHPVTPDEADVVFNSVLAVRGLTTINDGVVTRILPIREARTAGASLATKGVSGGGFATRLIPLEHVNAREIASVLEPLVSKEGALVPYRATNTLIASDTEANLSRIASVVRELDIPQHEESVEVIALAHADAAALAKQLTEILGQAGPSSTPGGPRGKERAAAQAATQAARYKIVPDERTNALVVVAAAPVIGKIRRLVANLDIPLKPGEERVHVYYAKFADAKGLVEVLTAMITGRRRVAARNEGKAVGGAGGLREDVWITADPATNAVIVNASAQDYRALKKLLEDLDIQRPQVFVEAIIAEVTVDRSHQIGFEFQTGGDIGNGVGIGRTSLANLNNALANPASLAGLILAATSDRTVRLPDGTEVPAQVALFEALATDTDINVLSAPTLLTLDNQEAEITVGQNVPFITGSGVDLASVENVFTTIERRDVGIKLRLTPQVSEGNVVVLDINEEVSALIPNNLVNAAQVGPTTTIRSASTTVSVHNGHTAVIGGLISDSLTTRASKVPFLGDIPLLGRLFRNDTDTSNKVNLIVFLTPHIIRNTNDLDDVSQGSRQKFERGQVALPAAPTPGQQQPDEEPAVPGGSDDPEVIFPRWPK